MKSMVAEITISLLAILVGIGVLGMGFAIVGKEYQLAAIAGGSIVSLMWFWATLDVLLKIAKRLGNERD